VISRSAGTLLKVMGESHSKEAISKGRAAFFAPEITTSPRNAEDWVITSLSTIMRPY
jgi:hypothetical protein